MIFFGWRLWSLSLNFGDVINGPIWGWLGVLFRINIWERQLLHTKSRSNMSHKNCLKTFLQQHLCRGKVCFCLVYIYIWYRLCICNIYIYCIPYVWQVAFFWRRSLPHVCCPTFIGSCSWTRGCRDVDSTEVLGVPPRNLQRSDPLNGPRTNLSI